MNAELFARPAAPSDDAFLSSGSSPTTAPQRFVAKREVTR